MTPRTTATYDIVTEPVFAGLDKISIDAVKKLSDHPWFNRTLCAVNDSLVRIGVFNGEFHWHSHEHEDEFFLVLEGNLEIEIEGRPTVTLARFEGVMVPKGIRHRPKAPTGATVLMVEQNTIVPTGS
jgi:mannose-6-phosphate isomerase-like protein (cupin superfamily)